MPIDSVNNEPELLKRIAEGDEIAFSHLYQLYTPRLKAYAWKFTQSEQDTEEILQESFLLIWLNRESLPSLEYVQAWIYKVVARCCLQWIRKQDSDKRRIELHGKATAIAPMPTPSDLVYWQELGKEIRIAISRLPVVRRRIYLMNREEGLKPAAISTRLDMSVGTVKNHLSLALKSIREHLIRSGHLICLIFFLISFVTFCF